MVANTRIQELKNEQKEVLQVIEKLNKTSLVYSIIRFALFALIILFIALFDSVTIQVTGSLSSFALFILLVLIHNKLLDKRKQLRWWSEFLTKEIQALSNWDFTAFNAGEEYLNTQHPFAADLGLFGMHSFFQMINRSQPEMGGTVLAAYCSNLSDDKQLILKRQEAVQELATKPTFRKEMLLLYKDMENVGTQKQHLKRWLRQENLSSRKTKLLYALGIYHILSTAACLILASQGIGGAFLGLVPFIQGGMFISMVNKPIQQTLLKSDKLSAYLRQNLSILNKIEADEFKNELLAKKVQSLKTQQAQLKINTLFKAFSKLEFRLNLIAGFILNYLFLWDVFAFLNVEKQRKSIDPNFEYWLSIIDEFDAYVSLGNFAEHFDKAVYPELTENTQQYEAVNLHHPLIDPSKSVPNNFTIKNNGSIHLITGANMAGKSTFLRALGIAKIQTNLGLPVFAESLKISPSKLFTSMLTSDNLSKETSYFLAEVDRLHQLTKYIAQHKECFIILDEILKGTNSKDKEEGSYLFLKKLCKTACYGVVATHDLELTRLEKEQPENFKNFSFEVQHTDESMVFDYKLKQGSTQTMNAMRLLKQKGLI